MVSLQDFRTRVDLIEGPTAWDVRHAYIQRFVDTDSPTFRERVPSSLEELETRPFWAYLWDTLKHPTVISEEELLADLALWETVSVFWDLHTERQIFIPNYWKFPRMPSSVSWSRISSTCSPTTRMLPNQKI